MTLGQLMTYAYLYNAEKFDQAYADLEGEYTDAKYDHAMMYHKRVKNILEIHDAIVDGGIEEDDITEIIKRLL